VNAGWQYYVFLAAALAGFSAFFITFNISWHYLMPAAAFFITLELTQHLTRILASRRILDIPNARSSHAEPVPRGGGLAAVVVFLAAIALLHATAGFDTRLFWALLAGGGLVAAVGLADDIVGLPTPVRFTLTLAAVAACCLWLGTPPLAFGAQVIAPGGALYLLQGLLLLWVLNFFNFMDGIDAIAGIEAITIALAAAAILWFVSPGHYAVAPLAVLAAAVAGFTVWNWPPAQVFMGDTASGFLGFCLGLFAIRTAMDGAMTVWAWMILFGVFFCDATVTLLRRLWRRQKVYQAHRDHAYQRFARALQRRFDAGRGNARARARAAVSVGVAAVNVWWLAPLGLLAALRPAWGAWCAALALLPLAAVALSAGAGGGKPQRGDGQC